MTDRPFRPLLAAKIDEESQLSSLTYPVMTSPKLDGVRCCIHPQGPCSRTMKLIPNRFVQEQLAEPNYVGLDGELIVGPPNASDVFARTISAVMSEDGEPDFRYYVFDDFTSSSDNFRERFKRVAKYVDDEGAPTRLVLVPHFDAQSPEDVLRLEGRALNDHYEGLMLRSPNGRYKQNRSTLKEQILIKLKRFEDDEATITGFQELERNENTAELDERGFTVRSSAMAGKVLSGLLGALEVQHPTFGSFHIGSGFDESLRHEIWCNRDRYLGRRVTFKYQKVGIVDKPRFPIFKGFRPQE